MKTKILTILAYTALVTVVLLLSQCEGSVTLTTVKKDARHIIELAQQIESEEELKAVEKLARKYEIGYQRMYNGAKALEFKRLTNDALREASHICDQIHEEENRIMEIRTNFATRLDDLEAAWTHDVTSVEEDVKRIQKNNAGILKLNQKIAKIKGEIDALAEEIIEANYPADMLEKLKSLNDEIEALEAKIEKADNINRIIRLAYELHGIELPAAAHARMLPTEEPATAEEATSEEVTTEETTSEGDKVE